MIKLIKQDEYWAHAIIDRDGQKYIMSPPYTSGKKINYSEKEHENIATFNNPIDAQRYMMTIFASNNLEQLLYIYKKYNSSGMASSDLGKISELAIKSAEQDLKRGILPQKELLEIFTIHSGFGLTMANKNKMESLLNEYRSVEPKQLDAFNLKINRTPANYNNNQGDILDYASRMLRISDDPGRSVSVLTAFSLYMDLKPDLKTRFDSLLTQAKKKEVKHSIDTGKSLAKPWQRYVGSSPSDKMNSYNRKGTVPIKKSKS